MKSVFHHSISTIIELFQDIATQGSGWNHSMGLDILVSRKYDHVPLKGLTSNVMKEKMAKKEQKNKEIEKESEKVEEKKQNPASAEGEPTHGGSYFILSKWLRDAKKEECFFNPKPMSHKKEDDNFCFSWCIFQALHANGIRDPAMGQFYLGLWQYKKAVQINS